MLSPSKQRNTKLNVLVKMSLTLLLGISIFGCNRTTNLVFKPSKYTDSSKVEKIYVYSFLDYRVDEFGGKFLDDFRSQLNKLFNKHSIPIKQLWFNESPIDCELKENHGKRNPRFGEILRRGPVKVPIKEVIIENLPAQNNFNPTHILIIFPEELSQRGMTMSYTISWTLYNAKTNKQDWYAKTISTQEFIYSASEGHLERAEQLSGFLETELIDAGVFQ